MIPGSFPVLLAPASSGYVIEGSGLFDGSSGFLSRTPSSAGNRQIWTFSTIIKVPQLASGQMELLNTRVADANLMSSLRINSTGELMYYERDASASVKCNVQTTAKFRDPAAFMHVQFSVDTTDSTASDRVKIYVNGVQMALTETTTMELNYSTNVNTTVNHNIGVEGGGSADYNGYMARATMIDGLQLDPTSFGEVTTDGFWQINDVSGLTFGTNGFLLEGATNVAAGTDSSGNSNNFSKTGAITATNDSPTNDADNEYGNWATLDALYAPKLNFIGGSYYQGTNTYSEGNLRCAASAASGRGEIRSTISLATGHVYAEMKLNAIGNSAAGVGLISIENNVVTNHCVFARRSSSDTTTHMIDGGGDPNAGNDTGGDWTTGNSAGVAVDIDNNSVVIINPNTGVADSAFTPTSSMAGKNIMIVPVKDSHATNRTLDGTMNYGSGATAFVHASSIPTGANDRMVSYQQPAPDVANYEDEYYIEAGISHTNGSTTAVTLPTSVAGGAMARIKRTDSTGGWYIVDTVRGANKFTFWDSAAAEDTSTFTDQNLTGTTLTLPSALATGTYMIEVFYQGSYFQMKTYSGNSANRTISFDGTLDTAPGFMFPMERTGTDAEHLGYHISTGNTGYLQLQTTSAFQTGSVFLNDTSPTTTQFTLGTISNVNNTGNTYICYAWANSGPYAFGEFTGNNNADGPMTNIGGSPKVLICKNTAAGNAWFHQNNLSPVVGNPVDTYIMPNETSALSGANSTVHQDFVANGVKCRATSASLNASAAQILTMAFGIQPIQGNGKDTSQGRAR